MSRPSETNINAKRFKSISSPTNINGDIFTSTSESIAKFMIEKLISLAVTQSHHQMIINQIPDYCFDKLKQTLQIYTEIQFLSYDRDDLDPVHHLSFPHPKSAVDVDEKISLDNNQSKQLTHNGCYQKLARAARKCLRSSRMGPHRALCHYHFLPEYSDRRFR